jgi:hypothetical protein
MANVAPAAPLMNHFSPSITHSSPSRTARVASRVGSAPAARSVMAKHERTSAAARGRRYRCFCSPVPACRRRCMLPSSGAMAFSASEARYEAPHSCDTSAIPRGPSPRPPQSSGRCGVHSPASRACLRSRSKTSSKVASSTSDSAGSTTSSTKARIRFRTSSTSGGMVKSITRPRYRLRTCGGPGRIRTRGGPGASAEGPTGRPPSSSPGSAWPPAPPEGRTWPARTPGAGPG